MDMEQKKSLLSEISSTLSESPWTAKGFLKPYSWTGPVRSIQHEIEQCKNQEISTETLARIKNQLDKIPPDSLKNPGMLSTLNKLKNSIENANPHADNTLKK